MRTEQLFFVFLGVAILVTFGNFLIFWRQFKEPTTRRKVLEANFDSNQSEMNDEDADERIIDDDDQNIKSDEDLKQTNDDEVFNETQKQTREQFVKQYFNPSTFYETKPDKFLRTAGDRHKPLDYPDITFMI